MSIGIGLLFEDDRYEDEHLPDDADGQITSEDIQRIMGRKDD